VARKLEGRGGEAVDDSDMVRIRMAETRRVSRLARDPRGARVEGLVVCIYHSGFDVLCSIGGDHRIGKGRGSKLFGPMARLTACFG
jgi:hypothetical protein